MNELAPVVDLDLTSDEVLRLPGFVFSTQGVATFSPTFDQWFLAMNVLGTVNRRIVRPFRLWVCCMLMLGESKWGEKYSQAMSATGLSYSTLANAMSTVKRFVKEQPDGSLDASAWHPKLSFEHHVTVQNLPEDEREGWLQKAEAEELSTDDLRAEIKKGGDEKVHTLMCLTCGTTFELDRPAKILRTIKKGKGVSR